MSKRILLVSNMYPSNEYPHYGVFVQNTEKLLFDLNFQVDKVVMKKTDNKFLKLINYFMLQFMSFYKSLFYRYDYVYIHFASLSSIGCYFAKKINHNINIVINLHGNDLVPDNDKDKKRLKYTDKILRVANSIIVPSEYFKNYLVENYPELNSSVFVYPSSGINFDVFKKNLEYRKNSIFAKDVSKKYIGYVSRIEQDKGWDLFLQAFSELRKENDNVHAVVVGDGSELNEFNNIVEKLELNDYIVKYPLLSQNEICNIFNNLDVFCFPTKRKSESLGLVGLEAMACGCLVITSNKYGPTSYLVNNKNGFYFDAGNYIDLKDKIKFVLNLELHEKESISRNAIITARKYDSKLIVDDLKEIFK